MNRLSRITIDTRLVQRVQKVAGADIHHISNRLHLYQMLVDLVNDMIERAGLEGDIQINKEKVEKIEGELRRFWASKLTNKRSQYVLS